MPDSPQLSVSILTPATNARAFAAASGNAQLHSAASLLPAAALKQATGDSDGDGGAAKADLATLQEGNDVYLSCNLDANPSPAKPVAWKFNGRPLLQSANVVMLNESLVLRNTDKAQTGSYECEAQNVLGSSSSKPVELSFQFAPTCKSDEL